MPWSTSDRRTRLPPNWAAIRRRILDRDPTCRCPGCRHHPGRCTWPSTEVDHIGSDLDHSDANLRGLCHPCHATRSGQQGAAARGAGPQRRRPPAPHPGWR